MDDVDEAVDQLYKTHFGKMVSSLFSLSNDIDLSMAEDIVHDGFSKALIHWRKDGIPSNAPGWMYTVCRNNALSQLKKLSHNAVASNQEYSYEDIFPESLIKDQHLRLLFICSDPDLPPKSQVVITLKYVVNLKVEAIAQLLGMTLDGVDKILVRARQKIKIEGLLREPTNALALTSRLPVIHKIIYLIFNEGYKSSWGREMIREELCEEALILNNALLDSGFANNETSALQALMLFNAARIKSRFNASGEIVELEKQDRSRWDADLIALATEFLNRSKDEMHSTYHLEASIAYLHCSATSFESTNWALIVKLYERLLQANPNPFVEVNYSIALFHAGERTRAFQILSRLQQHPFLHQYVLLTTTLGKLHLLDGDGATAKAFLQRALKETKLDAEKELIGKLILRC